MKNLKTVFLWMFMFGKRLLKNVCFIIIILLIPVFVFLMGIILRGDSGVLTVCLSSEDPNDEVANKIIASYIDDSGIISYKKTDSPEAAQSEVENGTSDAAWIFSSDLENKIYKYASTGKKKDSFITVIERETNVSLQLSHLVLFEKVYPILAYDIYDNFIKTETGFKNDSIIKKAYKNNSDLSEIVRIEYMNEEYLPENKNVNFLNSPLRGMLALIMMLCTISAVMLFIKDRKTGKYDWLKPVRRIIPATGLCLSAAIISALGLLAGVYASGINTSIGIEIITLIEYILAAAAFGTLLCAVLRSEGVIGALLPILILVMLAFCPIFFDFKMLRPIKLLLPPYYYLNALYDPGYLVYTCVYIIFMYSLALLINFVASIKKYDTY